ncbi:rhodanese-like domain-containing protein [Geopseudomonas aromaticivorans]
MVAQLIEFVSNHYVLSTLFVVLLALLLASEARRGGRSLNCRELTAKLNAGEALVLDVRAHKEFASGHIVDALNIPHDKLDSRIAELEKHKAKTLIVVDAMGQHAGSVCSKLKQAGYEVTRLGGGIASWRGDNLPVVK